MGKLYTFLTFLLCSGVALYGQCADVQTVSICDMTIVDGNSDGNPDGIINLYEELSLQTGTTITAADGMWFDPNFNFALDPVTGNLFLWDLSNSSEIDTDYQFELLNGSSGCPGDVQYLFNVILGPYSGTVASTSGGSINLQVCQLAPPAECMENTSIDLFQSMLSNPSPHNNGIWSYEGSSPNFVGISGNRFLNVNVPYVPGPPLVDEETFELFYTVPGITPCDLEQVTSVRVSVIREPFAGFANQINICETELIAGDFDTSINLLGDDFLVNENIEGIWLSATDPTGQITTPIDDEINLAEIYDDLVAGNPRFGSATYDFEYFVESRSTVCGDALSAVSFTFYEYVRPFTQNTNDNQFCTNDVTLTTLDLYDYVEFAVEDGVDFDYPLNANTNWTLVSGPSNLGLVSNTGAIGSVFEDPDYTSQGTIDLSSLDPITDAGTYVFQFTVGGQYNASTQAEVIYEAPDGCSFSANIDAPCPGQTTQVTIVISDPNYAGENTADLEFCDSEETLVLTDLLETDGVQTVYVGPLGVWTDVASGDPVLNDFIIPEIVGDSQLFDFVYNTTSATSSCTDSATLSFTVYREYSPGEDAQAAVCPDAGEIDLFTFLEGTPDTNGTWTGPNGYTSGTNVALFDPATGDLGDYIYIVPVNGVCMASSATVTVTIGEVLYAGEDTVDVEICDATVANPLDLIGLLATNGTDTVYTGPNGIWTDSVTGDPIINPFAIPAIDGQELFTFVYTTTSDDNCQAQASLSFTMYEQFTAGTNAMFDSCEDGMIVDLFTLLTDDPDTNGTWSGPNGYITTDNSAPFDPSIDTEGVYIYTVPANGTCGEASATVTVNFFDTNYAGEDTTGVELCEGTVANPLDLIGLLTTNGTDTIYTGPEGMWTDTATGDPVANPFTIPTIDGQQVFDFTYTTTTVDGCGDTSTLSFTIFEQGDAGTSATYETCEDGVAVDLFTLLTDNPDNTGVWSGPEGYATTDNSAPFDPSINAEGPYTYTIPANGLCEAVTAVVTVDFFANNYAGEDTNGVSVCESVTSVDLTTLLVDNGVDTVYTGPLGEFTDAITGAVIINPFVIPTISGQQTFQFIYTTTTENNCGDQANLIFTVFEQEDAGEDTTLLLCEDAGTLNLFNQLGGMPGTSGTWSGPEGYTSPTNDAAINPANAISGDYIYTIPANGACDPVNATVTLTIVALANAGNDINTFVCPGDYTTSLFNLLSDDAQITGEFIDLTTSQTVLDGIVDVGALGAGNFSYLYVITNDTCGDDNATITFDITPVMAPSVSGPDLICINDGFTLDDLVVTGTDNFTWYAFAEAGDPLSINTLLENNVTYFVSAVDANGCESTRMSYLATVLSLNDGRCQVDITNGVSDNGDGVNDTLDLGTLSSIFPNFDIQIFNRYGTVVYRGNKDTPLFDGSSNTGSGLGDQLPTGVYFYIFYPNTLEADPIDGTFYLSR